MSEYKDLIERLRGKPPTNSTLDRYEAADVIAAQAKRIEELERITQKQSDGLNVLRGSIANYQVGVHEARIAELEAALKPFANVTPVLQEDDHGVIYEWALNCDDIRQARKVLGEK